MFTTTIKKIYNGVFRDAGNDMVEPVNAGRGVRVRGAVGSESTTMRQNGVVGVIESHNGVLQLRGVGGVEFPDGMTIPAGTAIPLPDDMALPARTVIPEDAVMPTAMQKLIPGTATTAEILALPDPQHGQEIFDTTEGLWVKYNNYHNKWLTPDGYAIYEEE